MANADRSAEQFRKMTETPIPKLILSLAAPTILSMLITSIYNLADTFFVGQISTSASGAVGIVSSLMAILQALGFMLGHGSGSIISRSLGSQNTDAATRFASTSFFTALVFGGIITAAGLLTLPDFMMLLGSTETSMSFSAMLFGPFYFFYRKAWKPAFAFLAAELVLALPTFIDLLQITDSSLAPGLSTSTLLTLSRVCSVLSFLLMIVRGLYGKWLYRQSAAEKIRRIRAEFPDAAQRKAVLCAQGGTSWAAVLGCLVLLMVIGSAFTLLLGPNVDALIHLVYG